MRLSRRTLVVCLFAAVALVARTDAAAPSTIDFEELRVDDAMIRGVGPVYAVDGFIFTATVPPGVTNVPCFATIGSLNPSFMGSTSLYNCNALSGTTLTRSDGGIFRLQSIDLAEVPNFDSTGNPINFGSFALTFFGVRANGSTVQATATIDPFPSVTTFKFDGFSNLVSVTWYQGPGGEPGPTHQFDNVRVMAGPPNKG